MMQNGDGQDLCQSAIRLQQVVCGTWDYLENYRAAVHRQGCDQSWIFEAFQAELHFIKNSGKYLCESESKDDYVKWLPRASIWLVLAIL